MPSRAFGIDNRVARLNNREFWEHEYPIKRCCLVTNKALCNIGCTIWKHIWVSSHTGDTGDNVKNQMGESVRREDGEASEEISSESPVGTVKNEFLRSLQKVFRYADWVMSVIDLWGSVFSTTSN